MRRLFLAAAFLAVASGGCATGHAKTAAVPTPLDVPAPPPRLIVPPGPEIQTPPEVRAINTPPNQPPTTRRTPVPASEPKPGPPLPADVPVVTAPPMATLQQTAPDKAAESTARNQVREQLGRARDYLNRVNTKNLSADAKSQYDTAQRFVAEAEQALNEGNLVFAAKVAEKAAALAAGLPVR